jgi:4-oxalocrotonate tautomerase
MPYVNIQIIEGATREQKAELVAAVQDALTRILAKKPEETHIVIQDIGFDNWGFKGKLTSELRKNSA